jgi:hypothetical protein
MSFLARHRRGARIALLVLALAIAQAAAASKIIYVNRCVGNCTVTPGPNDAIAGSSTIPSNGTSTLTAFAHSDAVFNATVVCLRGVFARYDVTVTSTYPGAVPRRELMLAGYASEVGAPSGSWGTAPTNGGAPIDNAIAFAFANDIGADVDNLCWTGAQQLGFLYGLELEYYCPDIMSYGQACGLKTFTDHDAACGVYSAQAKCEFTGLATQNSAEILAANAGLGDRLFLDEFEAPTPAP